MKFCGHVFLWGVRRGREGVIEWDDVLVAYFCELQAEALSAFHPLESRGVEDWTVCCTPSSSG